MLIARLQATPWASGGRSTPNSACGRSAPIPHGPSISKLALIKPESTKVGSSKV